MPRTEQEAMTLVQQLVQQMINYDVAIQSTMSQETARVAQVLTDVRVKLETDVPALRQRALDRLPDDQASRDQDEAEVRSIVEQSAVQKAKAEQDLRNAERPLKMRHEKIIAGGQMICVYCRLVYDRLGDVIATEHYLHPIEDEEIKDGQGAVIRTNPGLKTLFMQDKADLDPADGRMRIGGRRVGD